MPKIVDAGEQRAAIRSAARRVFARNGVATTGLGRVAEAAGMGRSSLYHYYPDKASLLRDLLREALEQEAALFAATLAGDDAPLERVARTARALALTFDDWGAVARALFDLRLRDSRQFRPFFRHVRDLLCEVVVEGQADGSIDATLAPPACAAIIIGAIDGLLFQRIVDPQQLRDCAALAEELERCVRKALAP